MKPFSIAADSYFGKVALAFRVVVPETGMTGVSANNSEYCLKSKHLTRLVSELQPEHFRDPALGRWGSNQQQTKNRSACWQQAQKMVKPVESQD